jgi:PAS domain S-box-containing protein
MDSPKQEPRGPRASPIRNLYRQVRAFLPAFAVLATTGMLIFTIYFTRTDLAWIAFLTGVLIASILSLVGRASRHEFVIARRTKRLLLLQEKFDRQKEEYEQLTETLAAEKARLHYADELLPVMIAYLDTQGRYLYHNAAYRDCLGLAPRNIDGRQKQDVLGKRAYEEIRPHFALALAGQQVEYERTQRALNGAVYRLSVKYIPHRDYHDQVEGVYAVLADLTQPADVAMPLEAAPPPPLPPPTETAPEADTTASQILAAIENDQFMLYCQRIAPLSTSGPPHFEILVRLVEDEEMLNSPGSFFPTVEACGLMPRLDRWVVSHAIKQLWESRGRAEGRGGMLFFNVAQSTIEDPDFPAYVARQLRKYPIHGDALCFELTPAQLLSRNSNARAFARLVKRLGCCTALTGCGNEKFPVELMRGLQFDFLKIDGSVVLGMLRNPAMLGRVADTQRIARKLGMETVAEMVEDDDTLRKLRELGIGYAQGFGISRPGPLDEVMTPPQ